MRPELHESARTYHLNFSRDNIDGRRVMTPRHFILYRISPDGLEVGRILHDSRELARHCRKITVRERCMKEEVFL